MKLVLNTSTPNRWKDAGLWKMRWSGGLITVLPMLGVIILGADCSTVCMLVD